MKGLRPHKKVGQAATMLHQRTNAGTKTLNHYETDNWKIQVDDMHFAAFFYHH